MEKKVCIRNFDKSRFVFILLAWFALEILYIHIFPGIPRREEFVYGMRFSLRLIMGISTAVLFLSEFEIMVLNEDRIVIWQWLIPTINVRVSGKPYVAATIKFLPATTTRPQTRNGKRVVDISYEYKLYLLLSSSPILQEDDECNTLQELRVDTAGMIYNPELLAKNELPRIRYCENYHNALVEYYGCEIGENHLIDCHKNNVIL